MCGEEWRQALVHAALASRTVRYWSGMLRLRLSLIQQPQQVLRPHSIHPLIPWCSPLFPIERAKYTALDGLLACRPRGPVALTSNILPLRPTSCPYVQHLARMSNILPVCPTSCPYVQHLVRMSNILPLYPTSCPYVQHLVLAAAACTPARRLERRGTVCGAEDAGRADQARVGVQRAGMVPRRAREEGRGGGPARRRER
eukprot:350621-Chlamydomonas_euryale.AAC.7